MKRRGVLSGIVVVIVSAILLQFPLFNYLGYEFSVAIAFILAIIVGIRTISLFRSKFPGGENLTVGNFWKTVADLFKESAWPFFLPFVLASLNVLLVKNCSYGEGVVFYLLIPGVTTVWSIALASFCAVAVRRSATVYALLLLGTLLYPLYLGYATPQIYSYSFIYGYFPGFSYDEVLRVSTPLILFRGLTMLVAAALLLLTGFVILRRSDSASKKAKAYGIAVALIGLVIVTAWIYRVRLSWETSAGFTQTALGREISTEHFKIYYSQESFSDAEIARVALEHEFRFQQVSEALRVSFQGRIDSYIYPDLETKRRFIGAGNTNIAKPWRREIHLNKESWEDVLKHELVHVLAGEFGMPVIHAHYNIGLVEGLAMAVDPEFGNRTLEQYAAAMIRFGIVRDPVRLVKPVGFATQASTVSYVMMGAFCKFLVDRFGIVHFKELYGGASVEDVYGVSFGRLADDWQHSLDRIDVPASWRPHIEFYFRRPSIFAKECARTIADLNERGGRRLQAKEYASAEALFGHALSTSWNSESYAGFVRSLFGEARYDTVVRMISEQMNDSIRRGGIVNLYLLYGDATWIRGEIERAQHIYDDISALDLSVRYNEAAAVRRLALNDEQLRSALPQYFAGKMSDTIAIGFVDSLEQRTPAVVLRYVEARIAFRLGAYERVLQALNSVPTFGDSVLDAGKEEILGDAYFMLRSYQRARAHYWQSQNCNSTDAFAEHIADQLERSEWYENHEKPGSKK
ncbi:MAG TPA: hypothetical protein VL633_09365 [Bacteroidota bacterium]|nr:hypothetical protein [Bacteroidota bacterium]